MKVDTPQEVEVWYLLPAIRKQLVLSMVKQGLKQSEIAKLLHITDAAVSQYLHNKRSSLDLPERLVQQIEISAIKLIKHGSSLQQELQNIMQSMWKTKFICGVCRSQTSAAPACKVCYT